MPVVRTLYNPISEIDPYFYGEYIPSSGIYYCYDSEIDGKYLVKAIVHDLPGVTWVVDADQDVIDLLTSYVPFIDTPNPLFYVAVLAYGKYAQCIAPNPTNDLYFGHRVVSSRPVLEEHSWEEFRNIEYQIAPPPPE